MSTKQVTVEFTCYKCQTSTRKTIAIDDVNDATSLNLRRRTVEVLCDQCKTPNAVNV